MGRKARAGLDYRPLYVEKSTTEKLIRHECGALRMAILTDLTSKIFRTNGYYTKWNEPEMKVFTMEEQFDYDDVSLVVDKALEYGYFDKELYEEYGILSSSEIQEIYLFACEKKSKIELIFEYLVLDINSLPGHTKKKLCVYDLSCRSIELERIGYDDRSKRLTLINCKNNVDRGIKGEFIDKNEEKMPINRTEMPQIKLNKIKLNEIKSNEIKLNENKIKENKTPSSLCSEGEGKGSPDNGRTQIKENEKIEPKNDGFDFVRMFPEVMRAKKAKENEQKNFTTFADTSAQSPARASTERRIYGKYENVFLSDHELDMLKGEFPRDWNERIDRLSEYMESTGKRYKSHIATLRSWSRMDDKYGAAGVQKSSHERFMEELAEYCNEGTKEPEIKEIIEMSEDSFGEYSAHRVKQALGSMER